jgi:hypothetical protein
MILSFFQNIFIKISQILDEIFDHDYKEIFGDIERGKINI